MKPPIGCSSCVEWEILLEEAIEILTWYADENNYTTRFPDDPYLEIHEGPAQDFLNKLNIPNGDNNE